LKAVIEVEVL